MVALCFYCLGKHLKVLIHSIRNTVLLHFRCFEGERPEPTARCPVGSTEKNVSFSFVKLSSFIFRLKVFYAPPQSLHDSLWLLWDQVFPPFPHWDSCFSIQALTCLLLAASEFRTKAQVPFPAFFVHVCSWCWRWAWLKYWAVELSLIN